MRPRGEYLFGQNNTTLSTKPNSFRKLCVAERERLSEKLPDRQLGDGSVDPCCAALVSTQHVHPMFDFLADPDRNPVFRFTAATLIFGLSL